LNFPSSHITQKDNCRTGRSEPKYLALISVARGVKYAAVAGNMDILCDDPRRYFTGNNPTWIPAGEDAKRSEGQSEQGRP
jgi:hypothetical protein